MANPNMTQEDAGILIIIYGYLVMEGVSVGLPSGAAFTDKLLSISPRLMAKARTILNNPGMISNQMRAYIHENKEHLQDLLMHRSDMPSKSASGTVETPESSKEPAPQVRVFVASEVPQEHIDEILSSNFKAGCSGGGQEVGFYGTNSYPEYSGIV